MATDVTKLRYAEDGFIAINATGNSASVKGSAFIGLTDISFDYSNDSLEIQSIEDNFNKQYVGTSSSWTASASGNYSEATGSSQLDGARFTGDTKLLSGTKAVINAAELLELTKVKNKQYPIFIRVSADNYQKGMVIITSFSLTASVGSLKTFSIELQGVGPLTKVA